MVESSVRVVVVCEESGSGRGAQSPFRYFASMIYCGAASSGCATCQITLVWWSRLPPFGIRCGDRFTEDIESPEFQSRSGGRISFQSSQWSSQCVLTGCRPRRAQSFITILGLWHSDVLSPRRARGVWLFMLVESIFGERLLFPF